MNNGISKNSKAEQMSIELCADAGILADVLEEELGDDTIDAALVNGESGQEVFICDITDFNVKDTQAQLEHPLYSLSKKPVMKTRTYEHNGNTLELKPGPDGLPTIYDKDIIIFVVSQMVTRLNREGIKPSKYIRVNAHQLLDWTNRGTGGRSYKLLEKALDRLQGTTIKTNIKSGGKNVKNRFSLIDRAESSYTIGNNSKRRLSHVDFVLSDWLFNGIINNDVLTLAPSYFLLKGPTERRVYELGRKHCGSQESWKMNWKKLYQKSGSDGSFQGFKQKLRSIVENNKLPDYTISLECADKNRADDTTFAVFTNRNTMPNTSGKKRRNASKDPADKALNPQTIESAKDMASRNHDIYELESSFRSSLKANKTTVWSIDAQFLMYVSNFNKGVSTSK